MREGNWIKSLIRGKGIKQYEYAEMVGLHPGHLSAYLGGTKNLTSETLNRILSGVQYECQTITVLRPSTTGVTAEDAEFIPLEALLQPEDQDMYSTDPLSH